MGIKNDIGLDLALTSINPELIKKDQTRKVSPSDDAALEVIYLATEAASRKWTIPIRDWKTALNRFTIESEEQLVPHI